MYFLPSTGAIGMGLSVLVYVIAGAAMVVSATVRRLGRRLVNKDNNKDKR